MSSMLMSKMGLWTGMCAIPLSQARPQPQRSICVTGLSKIQAEDLLDWLEANGYRDYHMSYAVGQGFTVSCANSPGARG
ncbi:MAG TPA: hypothetical protein VKU02_30930 [Gemmataceae bacterium]|nr:hypothetical protein [Gemmataceae bacterium]